MEGKRQIETLLEIRTNERDEARSAHTAAVEKAQALDEEFDEVRAELESLRRDVRRTRERVRGGGHAGDLSNLRRFQMFLDASAVDEANVETELEEVRRRRDEQQRAVEAAEARLREAQRALEAVEQYAQRLKREQQQREKRKESRQRDEVASRVWRENRDE